MARHGLRLQDEDDDLDAYMATVRCCCLAAGLDWPIVLVHAHTYSRVPRVHCRYEGGSECTYQWECIWKYTVAA